MKRPVLIIALCAGTMLLGGCGQKTALVPKNPDRTGLLLENPKTETVEIAGDKGKRLFVIYGDVDYKKPGETDTEEIDPLEEVPEEYHYLYQPLPETADKDDKKKSDKKK